MSGTDKKGDSFQIDPESVECFDDHIEDDEYEGDIENENHKDDFGLGVMCPKCKAHKAELITPDSLDPKSTDPKDLYYMKCPSCGLTTDGHRGSMKAMDQWDQICISYEGKQRAESATTKHWK